MTDIETALYALGLTRRYGGFDAAAVAVEAAMDDPGLLRAVTKTLYPAAGRRLGASAGAVERGLRTCVLRAWERSREELERMAGRPLPQRPTNGEFVAIVARWAGEKG